eukprot:366130-Chlamydomonas_euryale.AAC.51
MHGPRRSVARVAVKRLLQAASGRKRRVDTPGHLHYTTTDSFIFHNSVAQSHVHRTASDSLSLLQSDVCIDHCQGIWVAGRTPRGHRGEQEGRAKQSVDGERGPESGGGVGQDQGHAACNATADPHSTGLLLPSPHSPTPSQPIFTYLVDDTREGVHRADCLCSFQRWRRKLAWPQPYPGARRVAGASSVCRAGLDGGTSRLRGLGRLHGRRRAGTWPATVLRLLRMG